MTSGSRPRAVPPLGRCAGVVVATLLFFCSCAFPRTRFFPPPLMHAARPFDGPIVTNWDYDLDGDMNLDFRKQDLDGDGIADRYLRDRDGDGSFDLSVPKAPAAGRAQRHLIICVDSVSFSVMEELWRAGRFRDFYPPGRVISTFPSDTNPAFAELFGMEKTPGVEDRYYDRASKRIIGGKWDHMVRRDGRTDMTFHAAFDYEQHPRYGALMYLSPYAVSDHDLARCREVFRRRYRETPADRPIILYIGSTDAIAHREGREGLLRQLFKVEQLIDEIICDTAGELRISLFSDHGNNLVYSEPMIDLERHLSRKGFRLAATLDGPRDVVVPRFGLVGDACLYTREENREAVAQALASLEGVDFSAYAKEGACVVEGALGRAAITRDGGRYRYEMLSGDPLKLGAIIAGMQRRDEIDAEGYADDAAWFAATRAHVYPDILRRLSDAVANHVVNRPDVFVSLKDGYCYGSECFVRMIALRGTHGSAAASQTNGMAMCTDRPVPDFIRAVEMMAVLGAERPGGSTESKTLHRSDRGPMRAETPPAEPTPRPLTPTPTSVPAKTATATATPTVEPSSTPSPSPQPPTATPTPMPPTSSPAASQAAAVSPQDRTPTPLRTRRPRVRALRRTPLPRRTMPARPAGPVGDNRHAPL